MNTKRLKKIFYKKTNFIFIPFLLLLSVLSYASENDVDAKIKKILHASPKEKNKLIEELKNDISTQKYNSTETKKAADTNKSIDEKIEHRKSKSISISKCGSGECGTSHGSKCGTDNTKCGGGYSHGSKCGSGKCGMSNQ